MPKHLLTKAKVLINNQDLSNFAISLDTPDDRAEVDVSGFNPAGTMEWLPGQRTQTITIGFLQGYGTSEPHGVLQPLFTSGTSFPIQVVADSSLPISATNPSFGGTASLYSYNGMAGQLNARGELVATFRPASNTGFAWGTT